MGGEASIEFDKLDREPSSIQLRDYQQDIVSDTEALLAFGDRAVIAAATGAGKSVIIAKLCENYVKQGDEVVVLTNISALVPQLSKHLTTMGIEHNIVKAGMHDWEPGRLVHLVMEQSFHPDKRDELNIKCDVLIKDEYHIGVGQKRYEDIYSHLNPLKIIGLSASPIDEKGYLLCHRDDLILRGTTAELIDKGYLAKPKYLVPKWAENVDYTSVRMSGNDYSEPGLREIIDTPEFTRMAIEAMNQINAKQKQTAVYCAGIDHAESFAESLQKEGYKCAIVHSKRPQKENECSIERFKSGDISTLVSVSSLLIGFDSPNMNLLVNLRPTRILRLWLQLGGRVLRANQGKEYGEILDLGQCVSTLGFLEEPLPLINRGEKKELQRAMEERAKPIIGSLVSEEPTEITHKLVLEKIEELKRKSKSWKSASLEELKALFDYSRDFNELAIYALEIDHRVHGSWYRDTTAGWIAEPWNQARAQYPDKTNLLVKMFKTRAKNIIKQNKKVGSLHYFID